MRGPRLHHLAWLIVLVASGCYNPKIGEGAFACGVDDICPHGFTCNPEDKKCYKNVAARDATTSDGTCRMQELECSAAPATNAACDLVCQSGCPCGEKCVNPGDGNRCTPTVMPIRGFYDSCDPGTDRCRAGASCLPDLRERCGAHCYRMCREDSDCGPVARCTGEAQNMGQLLYKVCSARIEPCNPTGPTPMCGAAAGPGRPWPAFGCYMLSHLHPDETVCECAGDKTEGMACEREYDCAPGNECLKIGADVRCRKLCTQEASGVIPPVLCGIGQRCIPFPNGRKFGFCMPMP